MEHEQGPPVGPSSDRLTERTFSAPSAVDAHHLPTSPAMVLETNRLSCMRRLVAALLVAAAIAAAVFFGRPSAAQSPLLNNKHATQPDYVGPRPRALKVAFSNMWGGSAEEKVDFLWILSLATEQAVGLPLEAQPGHFPKTDADIIILGCYDDVREAERYANLSREEGAHFITIFIASECVPSCGTKDDMSGRVDISFGQTKSPPTLTYGSFLRMPWWLPSGLERGKCAFSEVMTRPGSAKEWRSRKKFAAILSSHGKYPRTLLHGALSTLGTVDSPSGTFKNMDWPTHLHNSHLTGKMEFLRDYRWTITPENSKCDGYATEKLQQPHMSGTIPIYWGA